MRRGVSEARMLVWLVSLVDVLHDCLTSSLFVGAKFLCRISVCPILCEFDARIIPRAVGDAAAGRIHLVSVSGVDFAGRHHDEKDITQVRVASGTRSIDGMHDVM